MNKFCLINILHNLKYLIILTLFTSYLRGQEENSKLPLSTLSDSEVAHFQILVQGNNRFAFDVYHLVKQQPGNLYFSSYSIITGLGLIAAGAKGETANRLQHVFRYSLPLLLFIGDLNQALEGGVKSKGVFQFLLANNLWFDEKIDLLPSYKQTLKRNFRLNLEPLPFSREINRSVQKINESVSKRTEGKITNIIFNQDVTLNTKMVLTTAAYIKADWEHPFDTQLTKRLPFRITPQRTLIADTMQNRADYLFWKGEELDVIAIPYQKSLEGTQLAMAVLLPKERVVFSEFEKNITWENWKKWKGQMRIQSVSVSLPSFRIDKRLDLNSILKSLGLGGIFDFQANLTAITEERGIHLDKAIHKTSIKIDENGADIHTEKSLKKAVSLIDGENSEQFFVNRPFIFIIWDQKTDSILSMGRVSLP